VRDGDGLREMATAFLYVYVEDVDATYVKALAARAVSLEAPATCPTAIGAPWSKNPFGNTWQIATHRRAHRLDNPRGRKKRSLVL
jgi:PhnB protein